MGVDASTSTYVADRIAIADLMARYATMVDTRAWHLHDQVFTADAHTDYVSTGGPAGPATEVMAWLDRALSGWPINLHVIANLVVDFDDEDHARAHCYFYAPMGRPEGGGQFVITNGGSYEDRLVRTTDGWRIAERRCVMTLMDGTLPEGYEIPQ
jgi:3-phenylpropionate/cinnamic acid dioxygenase small subunit